MFHQNHLYFKLSNPSTNLLNTPSVFWNRPRILTNKRTGRAKFEHSWLPFVDGIVRVMLKLPSWKKVYRITKSGWKPASNLSASME